MTLNTTLGNNLPQCTKSSIERSRTNDIQYIEPENQADTESVIESITATASIDAIGVDYHGRAYGKFVVCFT